MKQGFIIEKKIDITLDSGISNELLMELWDGFTFRVSRLNFINGESGKISIGKASFIPLDAEDEYTVCIKEDGIGICGKDRNGLLRGFMMLLMCIEQLNPDKCIVESRDIHGKFNVENRMVHLCVFPETTFETARRQIRLCGVLQYTHIIIEFWGMLKFECMKELSWPFGFEKKEAMILVDEAKALGMEPVPMFNHLGHASGSREKNGKHVVLDQNLNLHYLFTPDGWAWNICCEETHALLRAIRKELYELFGDGEYIHLGGDEAYIYGNGYAGEKEFKEYLKMIAEEVVEEGRKPIVWADMLVSNKEKNCNEEGYVCADIDIEIAEERRAMLPKETILADWQYFVTNGGYINTSIALKERGYNVVVCSWDDIKNIELCVNTAKDKKLFGFMETAWHTLNSSLDTLVSAAQKCGLPDTSWSKYAHIKTLTATLLRKISEPAREYRECGFTATQLSEHND